MALIQCKECKAQVSDSAKTCPACGAPVPQPTSRLAILIAGIFGLVVFSAIFKLNPTAPQAVAAAPTAEETQKNKDFKLVFIGAQMLKKSVKNPDSFKLTSATRMADGTVCYEFRATNSFNAVVPGRFTLAPNKGSAEDAEWNKYCAGKSGADFTYVKSVL